MKTALSEGSGSIPSRFRLWWIAGLVEAILLAIPALFFFQRDDTSASDLLTSAIPIYLGACIAYIVAIGASSASGNGWRTVAVILVVGLLMRLAMFFTPALAGADHCRYRWDGAVLASGANPYRYSPAQIVADENIEDETLRQLARQAPDLVASANGPQYRTMYPPVAELLFAVGHWITPFRITGWRLVLLLFDGIALVAVMVLLRDANLPLGRAVIYFWNPLLVTETFFGSHLDPAVVAFVVLSMLMVTRGRGIWAAIALAAAIGTKLWPALLIPMFLAAVRRKTSRILVPTLVLAGGLVLLAIPYGALWNTEGSGLLAYSRHWYANTWAFAHLDTLCERILSALDVDRDPHLVARGVVAGLLTIVALLAARRVPDTSVALASRVGTVTLIMLLLSPTLYPWYYLAVLPFAVLNPRLSLLGWTLLLPLCYIAMARPQSVFLQETIPLLVHIPIWVLLLAEGIRSFAARKEKAVTADV